MSTTDRFYLTGQDVQNTKIHQAIKAVMMDSRVLTKSQALDLCALQNIHLKGMKSLSKSPTALQPQPLPPNFTLSDIAQSTSSSVLEQFGTLQVCKDS